MQLLRITLKYLLFILIFPYILLKKIIKRLLSNPKFILIMGYILKILKVVKVVRQTLYFSSLQFLLFYITIKLKIILIIKAIAPLILIYLFYKELIENNNILIKLSLSVLWFKQ